MHIRVLVLGVRGIPDVQGGVETHAQQLYPRVAALGCDVEVLVRSPFVSAKPRAFGAVKLRRIWSPRTPGLEAFVHSILGVLYAGIVRPDILHIHAVGPAIVTPIARMLGLRVVVTHHGPDYERDKWGTVARVVLRFGERVGMRYSDARIVISNVIAGLIRSRYGCDSELIRNGVVPTEPTQDVDHVLGFGLEPGQYFLQVSRIVPEKRQLDLIEAYRTASPTGWRLALVGGLTNDPYSRRVRETAASAGVLLTGYLKGTALHQIYSHAGAFVLPSSHEGLPIALLEALSYGLPVLASNIPANLEVGLDESSYFPLGDIARLSQGLLRLRNGTTQADVRAARRRWVVSQFSWDDIASRTVALYERVLGQ